MRSGTRPNSVNGCHLNWQIYDEYEQKMLELVFWCCLVGATYSYFWYPMLLVLAPARKSQPHAGDTTELPRRVAVVITARNEAAKIARKLDNTLALDRIGLELEVIVASDASEDSTDEIVIGYGCKGVRLVRSEGRLGKEAAQSVALAATDADLIVFTDVGAILPPDAIRNLLARFRDPTVGAVSSVDRFVSQDGSVQGEGLYVRYEMWLRDLETRFFSLVGLSGSFFAARRRVCQEWDIRIPSDFGTALNCVWLGMRAVSDRNVVGYYKNISDPRKEYQRKVRTVTRGMTGLRVRRDVLDVTRFGRFAFQVFSHKVMRWAVPWFLLAALGSSLVLASRRELYGALAAAQIAMYVLPVLRTMIPSLMRLGAVRLCVFFVEVNVAIAHATLLVISGRKIAAWEPSKR
jgi:glycosyltransferase involved in cell wall biosynthesis